MNKDFRSDNTLGCSPEIIDAVARVSRGSVSSYGADDITARVRQRCRDLFETDLEVFPLATGTGGNSLAIAAMTPPWGAVFCHANAHVYRDEMGAPEFYAPGAKLVPIAGAHDKLTPDATARAIDDIGGTGRLAVPACVSLTQATECGTVYATAEVRALADVAHRFGCGVHVDGARFANAVVATGASPADLTWRAGVDVLIFGATKNGAMAAEVIVVFRKELVADLPKRIQRAGQRISKMRFLSAQFDAYLTDDLWLRNARQANAMAKRLETGLRGIAGISILEPVEANMVFARIDVARAEVLRKSGFQFYEWTVFGPDAYRLVCGFSTTEEDVDGFVKSARA
ncbi:MAG: threonine aldolase family protein [Thermoanaerobaculia bacterium]